MIMSERNLFMGAKELIIEGKTALGIELGSTRIKGVLIDYQGNVLAVGIHDWENSFIDNIWTYSLAEIHAGVRDCYNSLRKIVEETYGVTLKKIGSIGVSAMMHGYMALDKEGRQIAPFQTWRNTNTQQAADELTELFDFNIPLRWTVAHLYQRILDGEKHVEKLDYVSTLSGYIHWKLTGERVIGVGDAAGMFPIDSDTIDYDAGMKEKFDDLIRPYGYSWKLEDIFPKVLAAGENAGYLTEEGYPYSNQEIRTLTEARMKESANGSRAELNRIYPSREAYISTLYDQILGYIDGNRFMTMEKSAIALKMTNGTGQFIRDYMFPKSEGDTIETISEQLGAYRDIKIDVLEDKIGMLKKVREAGQKLTMTRADIVKQQAMIRCIDIEDLKIRIDALLQDQERTQERLRELRQKEEELESLSTQLENELIVVSADLKSSDLGSRQEHLEELEKRSRMLADNAAQWRKILQGLKRWESDEIVADYISNRLLNKIGAFCTGPVTQKQCLELRSRLEEERQNIEEEYETYHEQERQLSKELKEKQKLLDDMKNNRKSYPEILTKARTALEQKLTALYGRTVKVWIFADLFDVEEEEWKNAVEGRLGRLKLSLEREGAPSWRSAGQGRRMRRQPSGRCVSLKKSI